MSNIKITGNKAFNMLVAFTMLSTSIFAQITSTIIGSGTSGFTKDGKTGAETEIDNPTALAIDKLGNIYFADKTHSVVRKLDVFTNVVTTVAGNGSFGNTGNGIAATNASLDRPAGLVIDEQGNLFISDQGNNKIRKVNQEGIITDFAGNGIDGYSGDGQKAINASLSEPAGMAFDKNGILYIADANNNCIRTIDKAGIIRTIAGNQNSTTRFSGDGSKAKMACLNHPTSISIDNNGIIYFTDCFNHRVRKINKDGIITTIAGTGTEGNSTYSVAATKSQLSFPVGLAIGNDGKIFFTESGNNSVNFIDQKGTLNAIDFNNERLKPKSPGAIIIDSKGNLVICDRNNYRILSTQLVIENSNEPVNQANRTKTTGEIPGISTN